MRISRLLVGAALAGAASGAATVVGERRLLNKMDTAPLPPGWKPPVFPTSTEVMVPTDDDAQLLVASAGPEDGPTVVLVHGLTSNHHDWGPVAERLVASGHRVIGVNQRGHGGSTVGHDGFGPERQGRDLGQVLSALALRDVVVCGHSMGGVAALSLMLLAPEAGAERVAGLALVATLAHTNAPDRRLGIHLGNTTPYEKLARHPRHAAALARYVFGELPNRSLVNAALASNARCPRETRSGAALGLLDYDVRHRLADIEVPTVVVCGDRDLLTSLSENREIADATGGELVIAEGAGHLVIWEQPDLVAGAAASLVTRITTTA
ncbi:MAG: alpha/beta hydrolase [Actinomycetota bacterium]